MVNKNKIQALLRSQKINNHALFSGLISVTEAGLKSEGLQFHETHSDALVMAQAAASTYRVSRFEVDA